MMSDVLSDDQLSTPHSGASIDNAVCFRAARCLGAVASVNKGLFLKHYKRDTGRKGKTTTDSDIREATAESLGALAPADKREFLKWYGRNINHGNIDVRSGTAKSLTGLAPVDPPLFMELAVQSFGNPKPGVWRETMEAFGNLAGLKEEELVRVLGGIPYDVLFGFLERGLRMQDEDLRIKDAPPSAVTAYHIRGETADSLRVFAALGADSLNKLFDEKDRRRIAGLFETAVNDSPSAMRYAMGSLGVVARLDKAKFFEFLERGLSYPGTGSKFDFISPDIRMAAARSIGALAESDFDEYMRRYGAGVTSGYADVRIGTIASLVDLAPVNPEKYAELVERNMRSDLDVMRMGAARALRPLAKIRPQKFMELYDVGLADNEEYVRDWTAEALGPLASADKAGYLKRYEEGITQYNYWSVRRAVAESLAELADVDPQAFLELFKRDIEVKRDSRGYLDPASRDVSLGLSFGYSKLKVGSSPYSQSLDL